MKNILVVDDEKSMCDFLSILLSGEGYSVQSTSNPRAALSLIESGEKIDMVITDLKMPEMNGLELLNGIRESNPEILVIMITAYATTENAVEAMKRGAFDYLIKPFKVDEIKIIVRKAFESRDLKNENLLLKDQIKRQTRFENIIGTSLEIQRIFETITRVADIGSTVLITGESGTGKELIAKAIHYHSRRQDKPFVTVNCGALPENLLETELFGHMKGSFTGAVQNKEGLFEIAEGGTFFLDEVAETTPSIQIKLLRVLNDKKFKRVGGIKDISVDVRIVAATNRNLESMVENREFREDLYYRLNVIPIHVPPLRERTIDIPLLAEHFIQKCSKACGREKMTIAQDAVDVLKQYSWPGNIRELENVIERCVALEPASVISIDSLPSYLRQVKLTESKISNNIPPDGIDLECVVGEYEKDFLIKALKRTGGVRKDAADLLRITFRSLRYRLKKYGLDDMERADD
ncbi:sigma-54-dependent Fis family transcriptional regulator [bacterium]|nr:sigma-54-dependent Fis family transcriptional regulator [candidate division CSSED10-310 bacterium]